MRILPLARMAGLFVLTLVLSVTGALAHAGLIAAVPAEGSVLPVAPPSLTLSFTEPVTPISFSLIGVDGTQQPLTDIQQDGPAVVVTLPAALPDGSYLASWRVTSADGHPVNGTVSFAVGAASGPIAAAPADQALAVAIWLVRALQYVALFVGVGSLAFALVAPLPKLPGAVGLGLSLTGLLLAPVAIRLQGLDLFGLPLSALWSEPSWRAGWSSSYGPTQMLLSVAFLLAALSQLGRRGVWSKVLLGSAVVAGVLAPTLSGHASTAAPNWLMRPAVFLHMASLMFWIGALLPLAALLTSSSNAAPTALRRFSKAIRFALAGLVLSGGALAFVQLGSPGPLWFSPYGLLLASKLAVVAVLLGVAVYNRVALTQPTLAGATRSARALKRSILVEVGIVLVILGLVAGWRFTPPPRVLEEIAASTAPSRVTLEADGGRAEITVTPGRAGSVAVDLKLSDPAGAPLKARSVRLGFSLPAQSIETITRDAIGDATGSAWRIDPLILPLGGDWSIVAEARTGEFTVLRFFGTFTLRSAAGLPTTHEEDPAMTLSPVVKRAAATLATGALLAAPNLANAQDGILPICPTGQSFAQGDITVAGAFARATPRGAQSAGAYLSVSNGGAEADTLVGASTAAAADAMLHSMSMNGNVMQMAPVEGGIEVPPGGSAVLSPMGYHLMLTGMDQPFVEGQCIEMVLHFAKAGDLPIQLNIGGMAQDVPPEAGPSDAPSHDMSGMDMGSSSMAM